MELLLAALVSGFVEFMKRTFNTTYVGTLSMLAVSAIVVAFGAQGLEWAGVWPMAWEILLKAAAVYALFISQVPKPSPYVD